jgi:hypothetical protein
VLTSPHNAHRADSAAAAFSFDFKCFTVALGHCSELLLHRDTFCKAKDGIEILMQLSNRYLVLSSAQHMSPT